MVSSFIQFGSMNQSLSSNTTSVGIGSQPIETNGLISLIMTSDIDRNGRVSRYEVNSMYSYLEQALNYYTALRQYLPFLGQYLDHYINDLKVLIKPLAVIKNNYDIFSDAGKAPDVDLIGKPIGPENQIDGTSIINLVLSAQSDGNVNDFSESDFSNLGNKVPKT